MRREKRLKNAFLKRLLLGLVFPFLMIPLVIAVRVYGNVRKDKAQSYTMIAKITADNMNEVIQKYAAVVESAATNEIVISMDADLA